MQKKCNYENQRIALSEIEPNNSMPLSETLANETHLPYLLKLMINYEN
jgi:hypothetical protein